MHSRKIAVLWVITWVVAWQTACIAQQPAGVPPKRSVVLLVHGISLDLDKPSDVWGQLERDEKGNVHWNGMIGFLVSQGFPYGGSFWRDDGELKLDTGAAETDATKARLFALSFSKGAATDGLAYKCMELVAALTAVRKIAGCEKVCIVAHSAGGLVARAYLQSALPDLSFRNDVDRLITIATPHLGSAVAEHFGDFLGTRATSVKPTAELVWRLNHTLDLPKDVYYASIVVRGIRYNVMGAGKDYDRLVDQEFLASLAKDFREGGDELLNVRTQNLRLAYCSRRYEAVSKSVVQFAVARVSRINGGWVHNSAPLNPRVQEWVGLFLADAGQCWKGSWTMPQREPWIARHAGLAALDLVEKELEALHPLSHVLGIEDGDLDFFYRDGERWFYRMTGKAVWQGAVFGVRTGRVRITATIEVQTDRFGRNLGASLSNVSEKYELDSKTTAREPVASPGSAAEFLARGKHYHERALSRYALRDFREGLRLEPSSEEAKKALSSAALVVGTSNLWRGQYALARDRYVEAYANDENQDTAAGLARCLAICPDASLCDGKRAVILAAKACEASGWMDPFCLDTLAAAYAETGQFDKAVEWQEKALAHPDVSKKLRLPAARQRLELYQAKKPYRAE